MGRKAECLIGLLLWALLMVSAGARADIGPLVSALEQGRLPGEAEKLAAGEDPQALYLLGWLNEGRYGAPADPEAAAGYYQRAAEGGFMAAALECWGRCVKPTPELLEAVRAASGRGDPDGLYLHFLAVREGRLEGDADALLLAAARAGQQQAIGELYAAHFLRWAAQNRTPAEAAEKLERCKAEGVAYCYYLEGALSRRLGDHQTALQQFQMLQWIDPRLFARHLRPGVLDELASRLPQQNAIPVIQRAAVLLSTQPATGNPRIDRFRRCAQDAGVPCVSRMAERDDLCVPPALAASVMGGFRDTDLYRACLTRD